MRETKRETQRQKTAEGEEGTGKRKGNWKEQRKEKGDTDT